MRKSILLVAVAAVLAVFAASAAFAAPAKAAATAQNVGVVDLDEVLSNHPRMNEARQRMATVSRQKEDEARAAADKETDPAKKAQAVQSKRMELVEEQQKITEPILRECQQATREVAVKQKLDLVLNKSIVLIGGKDITQDVIQQLAKTKAK